MITRDEIVRWSDSAPAAIDLTDPAQDDWVRSLAERMLGSVPTWEGLARLEDQLREAPVLIRLAAKLAMSRRRMLDLGSSFRVSVVFAMYKEHNRLRKRAEHPHGEDLLVRKVDQIDWLLRGVGGASWQMIVVDDGCPETSGVIAQEIVEAHRLGDRVKVLFLQEAIDAGHPVVRGLTSTDQSQKGGSIQYGMYVAARDHHPNHVVAFTDADLSTHLGQLGLLVDPIIRVGFGAAIGSRRERLSVVIKGGARDTRGKLFIYLWKRLIPALSPIIDTQCGFKGFAADVAKEIVVDTVEKRFAFDIELLLRVELRRPGSIERVAIGWIDSEAASTTKELQPYLAMLKSIVQISERYLPAGSDGAGFARLIESLDEASWARLASHVPEAIASREPLELEGYAGVSADDLSRIAQSRP